MREHHPPQHFHSMSSGSLMSLLTIRSSVSSLHHPPRELPPQDPLFWWPGVGSTAPVNWLAAQFQTREKDWGQHFSAKTYDITECLCMQPSIGIWNWCQQPISAGLAANSQWFYSRSVILLPGSTAAFLLLAQFLHSVSGHANMWAAGFIYFLLNWIKAYMKQKLSKENISVKMLPMLVNGWN